MSTLFSGHYLCNRPTLDIGVLGYIGIVQHKEHSPEVLHIPPGTPCVQQPLKHVNLILPKLSFRRDVKTGIALKELYASI